MKKDYENIALQWAERYGIIEYTVNGSKMIYTVSYPTEGSYKHIVDLNNNNETIEPLKNKMKKGYDNRG